MKGHRSAPKGKRMIVWFHSGRTVVDRFTKADGTLVYFDHLGGIRGRDVRRMSIFRPDHKLPEGVEVLG